MGTTEHVRNRIQRRFVDTVYYRRSLASVRAWEAGDVHRADDMKTKSGIGATRATERRVEDTAQCATRYSQRGDNRQQ